MGLLIWAVFGIRRNE